MPLSFGKKTDPPRVPAEFHHLFWLRLVNIIVIGLYLCSTFLIVAFVEQNVYRVIQSNALVSLVQDNLPTEAIQFDRLERVGAAWNKKHMVVPLMITRDPFSPPTSTPPQSV